MGRKKVKVTTKENQSIRKYFPPKIKTGISENEMNLPQNNDLIYDIENLNDKPSFMIGQVKSSLPQTDVSFKKSKIYKCQTK